MLTDTIWRVPSTARELMTVDRTCDLIRTSVAHLPKKQRKDLAHLAARDANRLRRDAQKNGVRSTISFGIGTSLGFSLVTGSLLALAAAKAFFPFIVLASLGVLTLLVCLPAGYFFGSRKADQEYAAAELDQLAEELAE